ncbi:hypothetical protein FM036_01500 [Nostoc sp. HG1]|nr:hypothetical protein [Nostoc sp. HG1]
MFGELSPQTAIALTRNICDRTPAGRGKDVTFISVCLHKKAMSSLRDATRFSCPKGCTTGFSTRGYANAYAPSLKRRSHQKQKACGKHHRLFSAEP